MGFGQDGQLQVTISKEELLKILKKNLVQHKKDFVEAQKNWQIAVAKRLKPMQKLAAQGKLDEIDHDAVDLLRDLPNSHEEEYEDIIGMLELHQGDTITIKMAQYQQWIKDDWGWKHSFDSSNAFYVASSI
jgi:hypothetical protein